MIKLTTLIAASLLVIGATAVAPAYAQSNRGTDRDTLFAEPNSDTAARLPALQRALPKSSSVAQETPAASVAVDNSSHRENAQRLLKLGYANSTLVQFRKSMMKDVPKSLG